MALTPIVTATRTKTSKPHTGAGCQSKTTSLRKGKVFPLDSPFYRTPKALWKLGWFLRDFGYDPDQLDRDELDDKAMLGLRGVVKISHAVINGRTLLNVDAFAPAAAWDGIGPSSVPTESKRAAS
jgi:hypothetical protein